MSASDGKTDEEVDKVLGGYDSGSFLAEFKELLALHNEDGVIPSGRGSIVQGDITKTLPEWIKEHPHARFCLINLDVDLYEPTKVILETCWDRLVTGGVVILDEYATSGWPGETSAWDDFLRSRA